MKYEITKKNLGEYLKEYYDVPSFSEYDYGLLDPLKLPLLQKDYGGDQDCTLVSITYVTSLYCISSPIVIYDKVEQYASRYGYTGDKGTFPLFVNSICKKTFKNFGIKKSSNGLYIKDAMWNFNDVIKAIKNNNPIILNLWDDGRNYYHNHTVTIIGYSKVITQKGIMYFLLVYDNWNKDICYIDYDRLSMISSINIIE